jgi:hypothetical protein
VGVADLFPSFEMKSLQVELAREACGLLIVAAGMTLALLAAPGGSAPRR